MIHQPMSSKKYSTPGLILLCVAHSALADDVELSPQLEPCLAKAGSVTSEMINCSMQENEHQDAMLATVYNQLMANLSAERKAMLAKAQEDWANYRETTCDFYNDPNGGTLAQQLSMDCYMYKTAERVAELKTLKLLNY
jgi:uncharacterized protein YecT (DUF1311 family)